MMKRWLITLILTCAVILPGLAFVYLRLYLPGYSPRIYNQVDIYKVNNGVNFNKTNPYLLPKFGTSGKKSINTEDEQITLSTMIGDEKIYPDLILTFDEYFSGMQSKVMHQSLTTQVTTKAETTGSQTSGLIKDITIDLPKIAIPPAIKKILGNKAGRLNLDGTQRITLSGTSTKRKKIPIYETNRGSRFDLKMQQDTNLRMSGTIGEKIAVNLKYNSNSDETLFDPNNINIKYTGDEDEIVQSIEAGNIGLSLSGSRYISYSTSSQGLFGITSKWKIGALDLTMIASKEEGQKNTQTYIGQSQADSTIIYSKNFANRTFYYLERPELLYALYSAADSVADNAPGGWVNNLIKTSTGSWIILNPGLLPRNGSVKVYMDDGIATNNVASVPGERITVNSSDMYVPMYDELIEGTDFITNYSTGTIEILKTVETRATIATRYVRSDGTLVPLNSDVVDDTLHAKVIRVRNQEYDPSNTSNVWDYQMRNVYSMGISNIKNDGFSLDVYTLNVDNTRNFYVPSSVSSTQMTFNQYLNLDTTGNDVVTGDDATVSLAAGYILMPMLRPFYALGDTLLYMDEIETITTDEFKHYISVKGKIGRDMISLGQTGVLKGSVKVKVSGKLQKENTDYIVDYDMGQITFLTAAGKDPEAKIEIDYEFRSGFAVAKKSLAGIRADWNITDNTKIGGTIIYRSESVAEKRPKIGSENMSLFLADIDGSTTWKPGFVTRWIDALPLIKTNADSRIALSGEVAMTVPNITGDSTNKNAAYIDDMEGILDSYPLGVSYSVWVAASKPQNTSFPKGRLNWYNPKDIDMEDVYGTENLTLKERTENTTVLAMKLFPNSIYQPGLPSWNYGGIMKYIGNQVDFSNKKYIELLVKLDKFDETEGRPNVTFHVDLGDINEDYYTQYGGLNTLNTEDKDSDGVLITEEDTGLDGIADGVAGDDPNDNAEVEDANPEGDYPHRNGTEGNMILDTEDLDNNGVLNSLDRYFSYAVSLADMNTATNPYLVEKLSTDYMLIRIPLQQASAYEIVNNSNSGVQPNLKKVSYVRLWAETDKTTRIMVANVSIVGNKWQDFLIRYLSNYWISPSELALFNESYISGIADNQKNTHYTSPKGTYTEEQQKPTLEQALTLQTNNLQQGHQILLRQRLFEAYNLLSYNKIKLWVFPENSENIAYHPTDSLDIIFRMGADSLNYYQVRKKLLVLPWETKMSQNKWTELEYDLQEFTQIKTDDYVDETEIPSDDSLSFFLKKGSPTLTNIREFTLGIQNRNTNRNPYTGITYFNDIRVAEPYEDIGWAGRISLNTALADFITFDAEYENKSVNFNPNIQRGRTQTATYTETTSLNLTNKYFLNKFFPNGWGLDMPLSLSRNYSLGIPRYRANSDLLRSRITDAVTKEREKSEQFTYAADFAFSQRTAPKSPILAYTINKTSLSGNISQSIRNTPTTVDTTLSWRGSYNYNVNLPENFLSLPLTNTYKIHFIPGTYSNNFSINASEPLSYNWEKRDTTVAQWYPRPQTVDTKALSTDNGITWNLTNDFNTNYRLTTKRDLLQKNYLKSVNIGKETEYNQDLGLNYSPAYLPQVFTITNSISSRYIENQRKYTETSGNQTLDTYQRDGNSTRTIRTNLTLLNSTLLTSWADKMIQAHPDTLASAIPENTKGKTDIKDGKILIPEDEEKRILEEKRLLQEKDLERKKLEDENISADEKRIQEEKRIMEGKLLKEQEHKKEEQKSDVSDGDKTDLFPESDETPIDDILVDSESDSVSADSTGTKKRIKKRKPYVYFPAQIVGTMAKFKNLTASFQNSYTQVYTRKDSRPDFAFQLGLPNRTAPGFLDSRNDDNTYTLSSGIALSRRIDTTLNWSYAISQRYASASNQSITVTFPDVGVTVSELETWIGIEDYITNVRLNSSYQYLTRLTGDINWDKPKQETRTSTLNPLLAVSANLLKDVQTTLSYNLTVSENITDMETYKILRKTNTQGISSNISYSYSAGVGIKLPFSDKKINIRNELTSSLAIMYEKNYDTTKGREDDIQVDRNTSRLSITPGATYQFDQNIKGGLTSAYEVNSDKKRDDGTRIFRLGIWIEIAL